MQVRKFSPYSNVRKAPFFQQAKKVCEILQKAGFEAYFVGGCVRDLLLFPKKLPHDIDIATSASPKNIMALFPACRFVGEAFAVCLVHQGQFSFEVATFRKEGEYVDKRRPESITHANLFEDSCRRDFTINAFYYNPLKKIIIDFHAGMKDIQHKKLRCVGNANARMNEDALRTLRALRFCTQFHLQLEEKTKEALLQFSSHVKLLAKERILHEFQKTKNFFKYAELICCYINLNNFFVHVECFQKSNRQIKKYIPFLPHPFLRFLLALSLRFELISIPQLQEDISKWPLTKQDTTLCTLYLNLFVLQDFVREKKLNRGEIQFLFFIYVLKIKKICSKSLKIILKFFLLFCKVEEISHLIEIILKNNFEFSNDNISGNIILEMTKINIPNYYTQILIDCYHYKEFIGLGPHNYKDFVENNLGFVKRVKEVLALLHKWI